MAFNFNWSPLIADTSRAREMLTAALNKSPKPPIIVDDIIVTELNLGSTPPELEILEIGDLAEDRFRGIFKMSYTGDAFLTLKTKVQANPLNTYLSRKPSFASPEPLAAASSLTIPLEITLSDIRLSGFVILVFSRQKGLTLVFRNDPLESLKVSSTFDSIPFIRDYLQKEIERQLRNLFMDDLPAILHRLSLRLWSPDHQELQEEATREKIEHDASAPVDPLASPPQDPVDVFGNPIDERDLEFSLDQPSDVQTFSAKNLLRLAALTDSQRTLSLFTPSIRDTVYRAWAGAAERNDYSGINTPLTPASLSRIHSSVNVSSRSSAPSSITDGSDTGTTSSRPSLHSHTSSYAGLGLGAGRSRTTQTRKRKNRVINLRKDRNDSETSSVTTESSTPPPSIAVSDASSVIVEERPEELITPPRSPQKVHFRGSQDTLREDVPPTLLRPRENTITQQDFALARSPSPLLESTPIVPPPRPAAPHAYAEARSEKGAVPPPISTSHQTIHQPTPSLGPSAFPFLRSQSLDKIAFHSPHASLSSPLFQSASPPQSLSHPNNPSSPTGFSDGLTMGGGILEQAWMLKMAREISRRVAEETRKAEAKAADAGFNGNSSNNGSGAARSAKDQSSDGAFWRRPTVEMEDAPPAYAA